MYVCTLHSFSSSPASSFFSHSLQTLSCVSFQFMMGHSRFLMLLLVSYLIFLLPAVYGYGRVKISYSSGEPRYYDEPQKTEEYSRKTRVFTYPIEDYSEPEPNTNPKNGYIFSPPSPVPAPPPRS